jgi:PAS domain S-box-containing protein
MRAQEEAAAGPDVASKNEIAAAMEALPDPVFIFKAVRDPGGAVTELLYAFLNLAAAELYKRSADEVMGRGLCELFPSVKEVGIWDTYLRVLGSGAPVSFGAPWLSQDGADGSFRLTASRFGDGLLVSAHDDTEQVKLERERAADRSMLRATVDSLLDPQVRFEAIRDQGGQIVDFSFADANPAACAYDQMAYEDLVGSRMLELFPGVTGAGLLEQYSHVVESGEPLMLDNIVYPMETMSGQERRLDIRAAKVGDGLTYTWRDTTDRQEAAQRLFESEEHYRLLAEHASDVVFLADPDRRVQWIAPSVTAVLGWDPDELLGTQMADLIRPEVRAATEQDRVEFYAEGHDVNPEGGYVVEMRTKAGDYRWLSGQAHALTAPDKTPLGIVTGLRDVTDVIRARREAEEHRAILQATLDSLLEPHVLLEAVRDQSGQIVDFLFADANPAACAYHRLDRDDLVKMRLLDFIPEVAGTDLLEQYVRVLQTGEPLVLDDFVDTRASEAQWQRHLDVRVVRVQEGSRLSYSWRDITARQLAVEADQRMGAIVQYCDDAISSYDSDGLMTSWNPAAERMLGYTAEEMIGTSGVALSPAHLRDERAATFARVMNHGEHVTDLETAFVRKDGTRIRASVTLSPIRDEHGVVTGISVIAHDLTKQVQAQSEKAEQQAREAQRLAELEQFQRLTVGRELKMIELKKEIEELKRRIPGDAPGSGNQR